MSDAIYSGEDAVMITVRLSRQQAERLTAIKRAMRRNRSDVVRLLIEAAEVNPRPQVTVNVKGGNGDGER